MTSIASPVFLMSQPSSTRSPTRWSQYNSLIYAAPLSATFFTDEGSRVRFLGPRDRTSEAPFTHPLLPSQTLHQGAWMTPRDTVPLSLISSCGGGCPYYLLSAGHVHCLPEQTPRKVTSATTLQRLEVAAGRVAVIMNTSWVDENTSMSFPSLF